MADRYELASAIFGTKRAETDASSLSSAIITGTAVEDSEEGVVKIVPDGNVIAPDGEDNTIILPTSPNVKEGDNVIIISTGGTATTPIVTGASGSGDRIVSELNTLLTDVEGIETLIREYSGGVLVAKVGNGVGALVNADGSFDVVSLTWNGNQPTVGNVISSFGENVEIGSWYADPEGQTSEEVVRSIALLREYYPEGYSEDVLNIVSTFYDEDFGMHWTDIRGDQLSIVGRLARLFFKGYSGELLPDPCPIAILTPIDDTLDNPYFDVRCDLNVTGKITGSVDWSNIVNAPSMQGGVLFGKVDATSTATAFTATVEGLDALVDGAAVYLTNGVVTSAANFTIDINGLGAKPVYTNLAAATAETTKFNINYSMLFIYNSQRVTGGCWDCYNGYDSNTNTIGYQLRTNSGTMVAADKGYRYRLWFTSTDGSKWVPANTSTSTNATSNRTLNQRPIDPFGAIVYYSTNGTTNAGAALAATTQWQQYTLTIGYSYMQSGFSLTANEPVYVQCTPQSDGSAIMNSIVQALPTTDDGKIYIFLGIAYSATNLELRAEHPVYYFKDGAVRPWTNQLTTTMDAATNADILAIFA